MEASTSADHESTSSTSMIEDAVLIKESLDFSSPWHFSDVVLVVGDTKLHVHKCVLSMWSPVFEAMFTSQFLESIAKEIPLPGKRAEEMKVLLKFIYLSGTELATVTDQNYQFLLQLADEYQMDRIKSMCSEFLVNKIKVSNCFKFAKLGEQFGLDEVTEKCYKEVRYKSSADLEKSDYFKGFEPKFQLDICMRIIKELERTLQEYATTCSDLVQKVYKKVFMNINDGLISETSNAKEHIRRHELQKRKLQNALTKAAIKRRTRFFDLGAAYDSSVEFEFSCKHCIEEIQQTEQWNDGNSYSIVKDLLHKLYDLHQNNEVARKAKSKKKAIKRKTKSQ